LGGGGGGVRVQNREGLLLGEVGPRFVRFGYVGKRSWNEIGNSREWGGQKVQGNGFMRWLGSGVSKNDIKSGGESVSKTKRRGVRL